MPLKKSINIASSLPLIGDPIRRIQTSPLGYRLARGVFWSMAGAVISRGLMLAATVLVARMLGKTVYGELGMIQSTVGMFGVFAGFGLGLTATKHVAEFRESDADRAGRIIGLANSTASATGILSAIILGSCAIGIFTFRSKPSSFSSSDAKDAQEKK